MSETYLATVLLNVALDDQGRPLGFFGFDDGHNLATACTPQGQEVAFAVQADDPEHAADLAFTLGNRESLPGRATAVDDAGVRWPDDVRSVSVGDVIRVTGPAGMVHLAVESRGFREVPVPVLSALVPLAGTIATSRTT